MYLFVLFAGGEGKGKPGPYSGILAISHKQT